MRRISSKISWTDKGTGILFEISDSIDIKSVKAIDENIIDEMKRDLVKKNLDTMSNILGDLNE